MRLVLATNHLGLGGSESYLLTVAEQLDRLGHQVAIYTPEPEGGVEMARDRGLAVFSEDKLPEECDAALVQDAGVSSQLAYSYPEVPQIFVAHSESLDLQSPPQLPGLVRLIVALNDRVAERMRSLAVEVEVKRLRQPIDTERFVPRGRLPEVPSKALLLSNNLSVSDRLEMLEEACREAGIELARVGGANGQTADPRTALAEADIVIGYGRSILEAMACGRAAYVYDWNGGDGWVTRDSYAAIEADGIAGRAGRPVVDAERLSADLRAYSPSMGPVNHDLVKAHHRANVHAQELVQLLRGLGVVEARPRAPLQEMARLARLEWRARAEVRALEREVERLHQSLHESGRRAAEEKAAVAEEVRRSYEDTLSWRLTAPLRWLSVRLRRR